LGESDATGQASSADSVATSCAERLTAGLLAFNSARSKLIANRMLPRPVNNNSTNRDWLTDIKQSDKLQLHNE